MRSVQFFKGGNKEVPPTSTAQTPPLAPQMLPLAKSRLASCKPPCFPTGCTTNLLLKPNTPPELRKHSDTPALPCESDKMTQPVGHGTLDSPWIHPGFSSSSQPAGTVHGAGKRPASREHQRAPESPTQGSGRRGEGSSREARRAQGQHSTDSQQAAAPTLPAPCRLRTRQLHLSARQKVKAENDSWACHRLEPRV